MLRSDRARMGDTFEFASQAGGRNTIVPGRASVIVQMLVVVDIVLESDGDAAADGLDHHRDKLIARMALPGMRCGFMSQDGGLEHYRRLAWDAAELLVEEGDSARLVSWAKILREVLRALPECDALAN